MNGKKLIVVVSVLAVASFTVAFLVTAMMSDSPQPASATSGDEKVGAQTAALAKAEHLLPRGQQLEDLIRTVGQKIAEVDRRDRQLDEREKRLAVAQEALRKDAQALDSMRVKLASPLLRLKEMKAEIDSSRVIIRRTEAVNLKRIAKIYEKMPSEQGGATLARMCRNNQIDDAAKILHLMTEKGAAKILGAIPDDKINGELFMKLKAMSVEG